MRLARLAAPLIAIAVPAVAAPPVRELIVRPGEPIAARVAGKPARLRVSTARIDRLTLDARWVAAQGIRAAALIGRAELEVAGRREFRGYNRPVEFSVGGLNRTARAFWFADAPSTGADGAIGPLGLPQPRVTFVLGPPTANDGTLRARLSGNADSGGWFGLKIGEGGVAVSFDVDDDGRYPVASAAAGALLARAFGGGLSGASWDVEILMGVRRPVRLLTLERPLVIGPLTYRQIAVRVRDRIDASGRGNEIPEDGAKTDPAEVLVEGPKQRTQPLYTLTIPRAGLGRCSRLAYDKDAKTIELTCPRG